MLQHAVLQDSKHRPVDVLLVGIRVLYIRHVVLYIRHGHSSYIFVQIFSLRGKCLFPLYSNESAYSNNINECRCYHSSRYHNIILPFVKRQRNKESCHIIWSSSRKEESWRYNWFVLIALYLHNYIIIKTWPVSVMFLHLKESFHYQDQCRPCCNCTALCIHLFDFPIFSLPLFVISDLVYHCIW